MNLQQQRKKFLLETLLPYKEDKNNCAIDHKDRCVYLSPEGKKCAVGRWMKKGPWQNCTGNYGNLLSEYDPKKFLYKKAQNMGFTSGQWTVIQKYHDSISLGNRASYTNKLVCWLEESLHIQLPELKL